MLVSPVKSVQTGLSKRCHWIFPVAPESVKVVDPESQILATDEAIVPATDTGYTFINPETLLVTDGEQVPLTIQ